MFDGALGCANKRQPHLMPQQTRVRGQVIWRRACEPCWLKRPCAGPRAVPRLLRQARMQSWRCCRWRCCAGLRTDIIEREASGTQANLKATNARIIQLIEQVDQAAQDRARESVKLSLVGLHALRDKKPKVPPAPQADDEPAKAAAEAITTLNARITEVEGLQTAAQTEADMQRTRIRSIDDVLQRVRGWRYRGAEPEPVGGQHPGGDEARVREPATEVRLTGRAVRGLLRRLPRQEPKVRSGACAGPQTDRHRRVAGLGSAATSGIHRQPLPCQP